MIIQVFVTARNPSCISALQFGQWRRLLGWIHKPQVMMWSQLTFYINVKGLHLSNGINHISFVLVCNGSIWFKTAQQPTSEWHTVSEAPEDHGVFWFTFSLNDGTRRVWHIQSLHRVPYTDMLYHSNDRHWAVSWSNPVASLCRDACQTYGVQLLLHSSSVEPRTLHCYPFGYLTLTSFSPINTVEEQNGPHFCWKSSGNWFSLKTIVRFKEKRFKTQCGLFFMPIFLCTSSEECAVSIFTVFCPVSHPPQERNNRLKKSRDLSASHTDLAHWRSSQDPWGEARRCEEIVDWSYSSNFLSSSSHNLTSPFPFPTHNLHNQL